MTPASERRPRATASPGRGAILAHMRFLGPILLFAVLGGPVGCATTPAPIAVPAFDGPVPTVPERDILALTPGMTRAVNGWPDAPGRVQVDHLNRLLLHGGSGGFSYDAEATLTAAQAFERREGNCLAFANLAVALGRAGGLRVFFQEATTLPSWDATDDTVIVNHHVNAGIDLGRSTVTLDVSVEFAERTTGVRRIDDALAAAHFYSNIGAEALLQEDLPYAYAALHRAIEAAPAASFAWSNLGLVLARNGQAESAKAAYEQAIALKPDNYSALNNLAALL
ncbi:MAG: tetratricopeptide repeat protein, partial [Pseudomonadota bacterium]